METLEGLVGFCHWPSPSTEYRSIGTSNTYEATPEDPIDVVEY